MSTITAPHKTSSIVLKNRAQRLVEHEVSYIYCSELDELNVKDFLSNSCIGIYEESTRSTSSHSAMMDGPLLTAEGERWLFQKMNFLKHHVHGIRSRLNPSRPSRDLVELAENALREAENARAAIVEANTRLVASIANKFANSRTEYDDLVSEGNMILVNAVDKFDFSRGFRFSTYATHAIQRHFYRLMHRKQRRKNREISTPTDVLSDVAPNRENDQPLDHKIAEALIARFEECLDEREAVIIRERFGLNDEENSETLKVVADKVGLSKERVRQLQMRAIEKLQDLAIQMKLKLDPAY